MLEIGTALKHAAEANGIPERTFDEWMHQGAQGNKPYIEFFAAVTRSRAKAVPNMLIRALEGGKGSAAAMWVLERRYREEYGSSREADKPDVKITIEGGLPPSPR